MNRNFVLPSPALAVVGLAFVTSLTGCGDASSRKDLEATTNSDAASVDPGIAGPQTFEAARSKLTGRWLRPDGGYVIEIRQVDADGQLDASYFNPNPIRVVAATAKQDGAALKVFIELNDVNYPGCKYNLTYIPGQNALVGTYYQAAMNETFPVAFERTR